MTARKPKRSVCACGRAFTTPQGLGLHMTRSGRSGRHLRGPDQQTSGGVVPTAGSLKSRSPTAREAHQRSDAGITCGHDPAATVDGYLKRRARSLTASAKAKAPKTLWLCALDEVSDEGWEVVEAVSKREAVRLFRRMMNAPGDSVSVERLTLEVLRKRIDYEVEEEVFHAHNQALDAAIGRQAMDFRVDVIAIEALKWTSIRARREATALLEPQKSGGQTT